MSSLLHHLALAPPWHLGLLPGGSSGHCAMTLPGQLPGLILAFFPWIPSPGAQGHKVRVGRGPHCDLWNHMETAGPPQSSSGRLHLGRWSALSGPANPCACPLPL